MKIVIDLQGAQSGSRHRGIGRYSLALAQAMIRVGRDEHDFIIILNGLFPETIGPIRASLGQLISQDKILVWHAPGPVNAFDSSNNWRRFIAEYTREAFIASLKPDVVHISSLVEGFDDNAVHSIGIYPGRWKTAVTFYDVIPLLQADVYLKPNPLFEQLYMEKMAYLRRADIMLAISESSRQEAIQHLGAHPSAVADIGAAADECFKKVEVTQAAESALRQKFGIDRQFVMYSGATDDRKNHLRLIEAYGRLPKGVRRQFQLLLVGRLPGHHRERFEAKVRECGLSLSDVVITGAVTDRELIYLYNLCDLFVFPSWHEGFGLPALEAMSCGAPVIGSNTTSLPEVIGRTDALFDPFDTDSIAEKMEQGLVDEHFRTLLLEHAPMQAAKFSWDQSAKLALRHLMDCVGDPEREKPTLQCDTAASAREIAAEWLVNKIGALPTQGVDPHLSQIAKSLSLNFPSRERRQLFVDVSELAVRDSATGIQRVVRSVLAELLKNPPYGFDVHPVAATPDETGYRYATQFLRRTTGLPDLGMRDELIEYQAGDVFLGVDLQPGVVIPQRPFLHTIRSQGVLVYFVVYDLLPILQPNSYPKEWDLAHMHSCWLSVISDFDGLICISRSVADEVLQWLVNFAPTRPTPLNVGWFHLGSNLARPIHSKAQPSRQITALNKVSARYTFLSVGTIEPRKAHMTVINAANLLWHSGYDFQLCFVGKPGWSCDELVECIRNHQEFETRLHWIDAADDDLLQTLYGACDSLIAASVAEGFGLPIVEAAAYGLPIIARDIPVFREVAPIEAMFFGGLDSPPLETVMATSLQAGRRRSNRPRGLIAPKLWRDSVEDLKDVIFEGRWHQTWKTKPHIQRYWASDGAFGGQVGERRHHELYVSAGDIGCALHGPYLNLEPGSHTIVVRGRVREGHHGQCVVDVVCQKALRVLGKSVLRPPADILASEMAVIDIMVPPETADLEVRLWVDGNCSLAITSIEISSAPGAAAHAMPHPQN